MKMYTKLFIAAAILILLPIRGTESLGLLCFIAGLILLIVQGVSDTTNKNNTPHSGKSNTPPWEK